MAEVTMTRRYIIAHLTDDPETILAAAKPLINPSNHTVIEFWLAFRWSLGIVYNEQRLQPEA